MKTTALTSTVFALTAATLLGQGKSDVEFLRARADAHERKIIQLEKEIIKLKSYHADKPAASATKSAPAPASKAGTYVVKKGDILTRIAYRHKTTVAAIIKENSLRNDRIYVGQKLRIPGAVGSAPAAAPKSTSSGRTEMAKKPASAPKSSGKHTVKSGETFYSIARQYKVSVTSLVAANPRVKATSMRVGQTLVIDGNAKPTASSSSRVAKSYPKAKTPSTKAVEYVDAPKPAKKTKEVVRNAPADRKSMAATTKSTSEPAIRTITVHQQMTYGQFASKYGASTTQLNALNGLSLSKNTMLAKGSELYVPKY